MYHLVNLRLGSKKNYPHTTSFTLTVGFKKLLPTYNFFALRLGSTTHIQLSSLYGWVQKKTTHIQLSSTFPNGIAFTYLQHFLATDSCQLRAQVYVIEKKCFRGGGGRHHDDLNGQISG